MFIQTILAKNTTISHIPRKQKTPEGVFCFLKFSIIPLNLYRLTFRTLITFVPAPSPDPRVLI